MMNLNIFTVLAGFLIHWRFLHHDQDKVQVCETEVLSLFRGSNDWLVSSLVPSVSCISTALSSSSSLSLSLSWTTDTCLERHYTHRVTDDSMPVIFFFTLITVIFTNCLRTFRATWSSNERGSILLWQFEGMLRRGNQPSSFTVLLTWKNSLDCRLYIFGVCCFWRRDDVTWPGEDSPPFSFTTTLYYHEHQFFRTVHQDSSQENNTSLMREVILRLSFFHVGLLYSECIQHRVQNPPFQDDDDSSNFVTSYGRTTSLLLWEAISNDMLLKSASRGK